MLRQIKNGFIPKGSCLRKFSRVHIKKELGPYCNATHDGFLCWPPTLGGAEVKQPCPENLSPIHSVYRRCGLDGKWAEINDSRFVIKKTLYEECFMKNTSSQSSLNLENIIEAGKITNILGITLLVISLVSIFAALLIYYAVLPKFVNGILHVRVQKHLFASIIFDATTKLTNQVIVLIQLQTNAPIDIPFACEFLATMNQYSELAILLWLANDSHFLQVTSRSGQICTSGYMTYILIGWGLPIIPTSIWAVSMTVSHKVKCWSGHTLLPIVWIMEVPKLLALMVAFGLLCLTAWRLYGKTKPKKFLDVKKIKYELLMSGLFFSLIFLSVLAIMIPTHARFGLCIPCQYIATIFTSSRGIYLSILYCFLNNDVHAFIKYSQTILPLKG